jgi:hypothetical protein
MDQALAVAPQEVDGFDQLLTRYVDIVRTYHEGLWGYVEIDQGGVAGKRATRAYLEEQGLRPIPVYHPITDGFDYFDELLERYDRICIGNIVMAPPAVRRDLLTMVWERRRRAPHKVWLHALGHTPNPLFNAYPVNSSDSSTHVYALRFVDTMSWGRAMLGEFGRLRDHRLAHDRDMVDDPRRGMVKKYQILGWIARTELDAWRRQWQDLLRVIPDAEPWPAPIPGELPPKAAA